MGMPGDSRMPLMKNDFGGWAQHYASIPYDHYKVEVYQLFIDIFVRMKSHTRVLDVGAGPGNLSYEYFKRYPESACDFVLLDVSRELLKVAEARFESRASQVTAIVGSYNSHEWDRGLGKFDAIVSNNSLFHLHPQNLESFYSKCFEHLNENGLILNQQAFGYESHNSSSVYDAFSEFVQRIPESILPQYPVSVTTADLERLKIRKIAAGKRRLTEMEKARALGVEIAEADEHQYLTAERHLECIRKAGFIAGSIWQKRDFAVLMGVKGEPLAQD
jgi:cyclopropane fatty-acyl-phospholipid synthase-like methyltransferase